LAVKQAVSASLITAERLGERRVITTTPTLTPTWNALSSHSNCQRCTASRSCVATGMRIVRAAILEHDRELVAADPREELAFAQRRLQHRGQGAAAARRRRGARRDR
jgi:hypothetical protein